MFNYSGLLRQPFEHIKGAFEPNLITIDEIENYLNNHKFLEDELSVIDPDTNVKSDYNSIPGPWRKQYDPKSITNLWESGFAFILHTPFINNKVKQIVAAVEASNFASADAHIYCGKKTSKSFHPHSDNNWNIIIQCSGVTEWNVWDAKSMYDAEVFENGIDQDPQWNFYAMPGDALILPRYQIHQAIPMTDRISVSIPFAPGPRTIQKDMKLSWDD